MKYITALIICLLTINLSAQENSIQKGLKSITPEAIQGQLEFLSSDWMEGRETGKRGQYMAADYIASMFKVYGLEPAAPREKAPHTFYSQYKYYGEESYFQDFYLNEYESGENQEFSILSLDENSVNYNFRYKTDFSVKVSEVPQQIEAEVVFAGYGFRNADGSYDDLEDIDVKGKVVVLLKGFPGHNAPESDLYKKMKPKGRWWKWVLERGKRERLAKLGAAAVIEVDPGKDAVDYFKSNTPFRYHKYPYYEGPKNLTTREKSYELVKDEIPNDLPIVYLSNRALNILLEGESINIKQYENNVANTLKPESKEIIGKKVRIATDVNSNIISTRNVLGKIEGKYKDTIVVIGAHYDHEGMRDGFIYNGADDNASGTVGVMTIAKAFAELGEQPEYTIIFAAWTGEERGLLGSEYFVMDPPEGHIKFYFNFDMLARSSESDTSENICYVRYTSTNPKLEEQNEQIKKEGNYNIDFKYSPDPKPQGGSDFTAFAEADIPIMGYFTGLHDEYHTPLDQEERVNYDKMIPLVKMGFINIYNIANKGLIIK